MENSLLTAENIIYHLRQNRSNRKDFKIVKLLENIEKHDFENNTQQNDVLEEILQILFATSTHMKTDDATGIGCVIWLTYLQEQQKLPCLSESQFGNLLQWILDQQQYYANNIDAICKILIAIGSLFSLHPSNGDKYLVVSMKPILKYIYDSTSTPVLLITAFQCVDKILSTLKDLKLTDEQRTVCADTGHRLVQLHYDNSNFYVDNGNVLIIVLLTLQILHKIVMLDDTFAKLQIAELLGISRAYFHFGIEENQTFLIRPQKVFMSQQAQYTSAEETDTINLKNARSCRGKTPKTRKPRAVVKNVRSNDHKTVNLSSENKNMFVFDIKFSDSEASEPESSSNRILFERNRKAKVRLASINLVGELTRQLDRKNLFGYWHAFFPNGTESIDNLLYIGQHDPNLRCRSAALQVCAHLLYGSKGFLHQAEINVKRCPTTFIPFSVSLGYTVLAIYKSLTTILSSESSLPVLTQALKCLAVLVQASPFQQFERGFVQNFVKDVKPLVYHRDAAIQVSALMVMEFLVALPELTDDVVDAVGLPPESARNKRSQINHVSDDEIDIVEIEEFFDSDDENTQNKIVDESAHVDLKSALNTTCETSWLLNRVLHNLSIQRMHATSVRIESLQVLTAISAHFAMIKPHLAKVSDVLQHSLNDALPDVRLYAARCVDECAYQIARYLLDNASCSENEIEECNKFWLNMMPIIMDHIGRDAEEITTVRITLCDALSNIGVIIFERTVHSTQMCLLSFLSGVSSDNSEEAMVRAAAVRALAVFSLYPSLRGDLVFIENTAEITLGLVNDANLLVRVKSFWSFGNISAAFMGKGPEDPNFRDERFSDDLLYRLITAAITACSDNDKVRCNAVRTLGNLLRLLTEQHFNSESSKMNWRQLFVKSICKLTDCIRSSGNAKVKWNTCYAISNLMRNQFIFNVTDLNWQETLFAALCNVIVNHSNFKVRTSASSVIANITQRAYFGNYYEKVWSSVLESIEKSYNLDNFYEYNHRDSLQEQLCVALCHIISLANNDDLPMIKKHLLTHVEVIRNTWKRIINRMVPEKAAPLLSCPVILLERSKNNDALSMEQKSCIDYLINVLSTE